MISAGTARTCAALIYSASRPSHREEEPGQRSDRRERNLFRRFLGRRPLSLHIHTHTHTLGPTRQPKARLMSLREIWPDQSGRPAIASPSRGVPSINNIETQQGCLNGCAGPYRARCQTGGCTDIRADFITLRDAPTSLSPCVLCASHAQGPRATSRAAAW